MIYCAIIAFFLCFVFIFYISRHSWAMMALESGAPVNTISECLGHSSEGVTRIYLRELDRSVLDKVNDLVAEQIG